MSESPSAIIVVAIAVHEGNAGRAEQLLGWLVELGGGCQSSCLLAYDRSLSADDRHRLRELANAAFGGVEVLRCDTDGTPPETTAGANRLFQAVADQMAEVIREPFLWLPPEAVPLRDNWMTAIDYEYTTAGKAFMGPVWERRQPCGHAQQYLGPVAVYPADARDLIEPHWAGQDPWFVGSARRVLPFTHPTRLIGRNVECDHDVVIVHFDNPNDAPSPTTLKANLLCPAQ